MAASTVVLMASALNLYEGRSLDQRLHNAFRNFISWCKNNRRVTSVSDFSKLAFDMVSTLVFLWQHVLSLNHFGPGSQLYVKDRYVDRPFGVPFFSHWYSSRCNIQNAISEESQLPNKSWGEGLRHSGCPSLAARWNVGHGIGLLIADFLIFCILHVANQWWWFSGVLCMSLKAKCLSVSPINGWKVVHQSICVIKKYVYVWLFGFSAWYLVWSLLSPRMTPCFEWQSTWWTVPMLFSESVAGMEFSFLVLTAAVLWRMVWTWTKLGMHHAYLSQCWHTCSHLHHLTCI